MGGTWVEYCVFAERRTVELLAFAPENNSTIFPDRANESGQERAQRFEKRWLHPRLRQYQNELVADINVELQNRPGCAIKLIKITPRRRSDPKGVDAWFYYRAGERTWRRAVNFKYGDLAQASNLSGYKTYFGVGIIGETEADALSALKAVREGRASLPGYGVVAIRPSDNHPVGSVSAFDALYLIADPSWLFTNTQNSLQVLIDAAVAAWEAGMLHRGAEAATTNTRFICASRKTQADRIAAESDEVLALCDEMSNNPVLTDTDDSVPEPARPLKSQPRAGLVKPRTGDEFELAVSRKVVARGMGGKNGELILRAGSYIRANPSCQDRSPALGIYADLVSSGGAIEADNEGWLVLTRDVRVGSASLAARLVLDRRTGGPASWKRNDGKKLAQCGRRKRKKTKTR